MVDYDDFALMKMSNAISVVKESSELSYLDLEGVFVNQPLGEKDVDTVQR